MDLKSLRLVPAPWWRLLAALGGLLLALVAGCSRPAAVPDGFVRVGEPGGTFSVAIPPDWELDAGDGSYRLFAGLPSVDAGVRYDATVGLTWAPPPCDRSMIDDVPTWYADVFTFGDGRLERSREETEVDGRRALLVVSDVTLAGGGVSRELTLISQAYGVIWQVTCCSTDAGRFEEFRAVFREIVSSLEVRGAWTSAAG